MELELLLIAVGFDEHIYLKWVILLHVEYRILTFLFGKLLLWTESIFLDKIWQ